MLYGQAPLHSQTRDELLAKLCDPAEASTQYPSSLHYAR